MKNKISILCTAIVVFCTAANSYSQNYEIGTWEGFRTSAVTFTFDDNCANQFTAALPIFDRLGYKASFYPVINWSPNWNTLKSMVANGHEVGSHSVTHGQTVTDAEMSSSKNTIEQNIPGVKCNTITYPNCNVPNPESSVSKYFIGGRVCDGQVANTTPSNYNRIGSIICGNAGSCNSLANFQTQLNTAKNKKGWAVFLIHEVNNGSGYSPLQASVIESTLNYIKQNDGDFWVTTFRNAILYSKERNAATVREVSSTANEITLNVTDNLDNATYNYPLSIRRAAPAGWTSITATQGGKEIEASIKSGYIYFSAVPDGGTVVLTTGTPISGYTVSASASPATGGKIVITPESPNGRYNGETVSLTPVPSTNWEFAGWSGDASGNDVPLSIKMDKDITVSANFILVGDDTDNGLIRNGNFSGTTGWTFSQWEGAGTFTVSGNEANISVTAVGTADYNIQLVQNGIAMEKGMKYRLTFDASATADRVISVFMQLDSDPFTSYFEQSVDLTTGKESFSYEFEMKETTDPNGRIAINVGNATSTVKISNIEFFRIAEFSPEDPGGGVNISETPAVADANLHVYVLPNSAVNVNFTATGSGETELRLYSLNGSLIASDKLYTLAGKNYSHTFDQGKFPGGFYVVWINSNGKVERAKVAIPN
ncbi:MAG: carbohydrate binding domain-containing protein [Prevotellaceae bacterium]|jgi:oligosaccharide reducing-end xylanase|nr:carbohydrate binding domain-containing protein [Prevotellaceae bacterium]